MFIVLNDYFNYIGLFVFFILSVMVAILIAILTVLVSFKPLSSNFELGTAYECGFLPFGDSRMKFDVQFYLVAILFVIFDIEVCLLFPWAVSVTFIGFLGLSGMLIFFILLGVGFLVE